MVATAIIVLASTIDTLNIIRIGMKHTLLKRLIVLLCIVASVFNFNANAEGTKTVSPTNSNLTSLVIIPYRNSGSFLNCSEDNRIYFRIKDHTVENFYFGFD